MIRPFMTIAQLKCRNCGNHGLWEQLVEKDGTTMPQDLSGDVLIDLVKAPLVCGYCGYRPPNQRSN